MIDVQFWVYGSKDKPWQGNFVTEVKWDEAVILSPNEVYSFDPIHPTADSYTVIKKDARITAQFDYDDIKPYTSKLLEELFLRVNASDTPLFIKSAWSAKIYDKFKAELKSVDLSSEVAEKFHAAEPKIAEGKPFSIEELESELKAYTAAERANKELSDMSMHLPGIHTIIEKGCPVQSCKKGKLFIERYTLRSLIMHLNDEHYWTRERIADWIDILHDSGIIDAEFKIDPVEMPDHVPTDLL